MGTYYVQAMKKKRVSKGGPGQDAGCQATRHGSFKIVSDQCDPDRPWAIDQPSKGPTMSIKTLIAICAAAGKDHSDIVRKVSCPTLLAVADESLGWQEAINFAAFPHAARSVIRSNHWLISGNPTELNRAVETWLATGNEDHAREAT